MELRRSYVGLATVAVTLLLAQTGAAADSRGDRGGTATSTDDGASVTAYDLGTPGAPTKSSGGTVSCHYIEVGENLHESGYGGYDGLVAGFNVADSLVENWWYVSACTVNGQPQDPQLFQWVPGEGTPIDAEYLAREAIDTLTIAFPDPATSPPADFQQLVGLRTWMWIDDAGYTPASATASLPGLSVTATATPASVTWDMGDGSEPIVCDGPGTPYNTATPDDQQSTECSHIFQVAGDYSAQATVTWSIEWSATNGDGGTLPDVARTTTFDLAVIERQAVIIENP